jgi:hypothetical protein
MHRTARVTLQCWERHSAQARSRRHQRGGRLASAVGADRNRALQVALPQRFVVLLAVRGVHQSTTRGPTTLTSSIAASSRSSSAARPTRGWATPGAVMPYS